jgi:hypothetical protein
MYRAGGRQGPPPVDCPAAVVDKGAAARKEDLALRHFTAPCKLDSWWGRGAGPGAGAGTGTGVQGFRGSGAGAGKGAGKGAGVETGSGTGAGTGARAGALGKRA